jgi:hypothetical protein
MLGTVYLGKDLRTDREVVLKVDRYDGFDSDLFHEYKIYKDIVGCLGISKVYWYGLEGCFNVMVMDRFDISLDELVQRTMLEICDVASFADQMVSKGLILYRRHVNTFM